MDYRQRIANLFIPELQRLEQSGRLTEQKREQWLHALTHVVDLFVEVAPDKPKKVSVINPQGWQFGRGPLHRIR